MKNKKILKKVVGIEFALCCLFTVACSDTNQNEIESSLSFTEPTPNNPNNPFGPNNPNNPVVPGEASIGSSSEEYESNSISPSYGFSEDVTIDENVESNLTITTDVVDGYTYDEASNTYTITTSGTYALSGSLYEGVVCVCAPEAKVTLDLSGVTISNSKNSPIYIEDADSVDISAKSGTENFVYDLRPYDTLEENTVGSAGIYALCDLTIKGKGALTVISNYNNGIHTKDDLEIKNLTLIVKAVNNALKGNDSLTISSGIINAISQGGDALKTTSTDLSKNGVQRGIITISGGEVNLYAACDGIDAASDVVIDGGTINIYTDKYSSYTADEIVKSESQMYLRTSQTIYNYNYNYSAYFYDIDGNYEWKDLTFYKSIESQMPGPGQRGGGRPIGSTYYYYVVDIPSNYTNVIIYAYASGTETKQDTNYLAKTTKDSTIPSSYDTYTISAISESSKVITSSGWTAFKSASGNTGLDYSCKGIKAANNITINDGAINIESTDDGIHSNFDDILESTNAKGLGNITIAGGDITITTSDDGIHADQDLYITGGNINIKNSYEGLEANRIYVSGGNSLVYAKDDGINANSKGAYSAYIEFSGGVVDVTVPSGDTDTVDSNGKILVSGGLIILRNGNNNGQSMTGGTFDTDNGVTVTGGTVISIGCIGDYVTGATTNTQTTLASGDYKLVDANGVVIAEFSLSQSYRAYMFWSDKFVKGTTYSLYQGETLVLSFTA